MKSALINFIRVAVSALILFAAPFLFASTQVLDVNQVQVITAEGLGWLEDGVFSPDGKHFYVSAYGKSGIAVFDHDESVLTLKHIHLNGSEGIANLVAPDAMAFNGAGTMLFVANNEPFGHVVSFSRNPVTGTLSAIDSDAQSDWWPNELALSPDGSFLFVLEFGPRVFTYAVSETGAVQNPVETALAFRPDNIALSPDGKFLYFGSWGDEVEALSIAENGALTPIQHFDSNTPGFEGLSGAYLNGGAVFSPSGEEMYIADSRGSNSRLIHIFDRDLATGLLSFRSTFTDEDLPWSFGQRISIDIDPEGGLLCAGNELGFPGSFLGCYDRADNGDLSGGVIFLEDDLPGLFSNRALAFSDNPSNKGLVTVSRSGVLNRFSYSTGAASVAFEGTDSFLPGEPSLKMVRDVLVSHDGKYVYTASWTSQVNAIITLKRDPATGLLQVDDQLTNYDISQLSAPYDIAFSPDQRWLFVADLGSDSVITLERNPLTGSLSLAGILPESANEFGSTMRLTVSPDGQNVYVTSTRGSIAILSINPDGTLGLVDTILPADIPALDNPSAIVVSPDGEHVYVTDSDADSLMVFARTTVDGSLSLVQTLPGDGSQGLTFANPSDMNITPDGKFVTFRHETRDGPRGLFFLNRNSTTGEVSLASHLDGTFGQSAISKKSNLMAILEDTNKLSMLKYDPATGALSRWKTFTDNTAGVDGLHSVSGLTFSADGLNLYSAANWEGSVATYNIDQLETTNQEFDTARDFLLDPPASDPFVSLDFNDGFNTKQDAVVSVLDANITNVDGLTITSENATWQDNADDGVFLGFAVDGDFEAMLTIKSMDVSDGHGVGLMLRVQPGADLDAGGAGQDYVAIGASGDIARVSVYNTDNGVTAEFPQSASTALSRSNGTGIPAQDLHTRIQRNGSVLKLDYRSGDGDWINADSSPISRPDMEGLVLEIGIYQTSNTTSTAVIDFFSVRSDTVFLSGFE